MADWAFPGKLKKSSGPCLAGICCRTYRKTQLVNVSNIKPDRRMQSVHVYSQQDFWDIGVLMASVIWINVYPGMPHRVILVCRIELSWYAAQSYPGMPHRVILVCGMCVQLSRVGQLVVLTNSCDNHRFIATLKSRFWFNCTQANLLITHEQY